MARLEYMKKRLTIQVMSVSTCTWRLGMACRMLLIMLSPLMVPSVMPYPCAKTGRQQESGWGAGHGREPARALARRVHLFVEQPADDRDSQECKRHNNVGKVGVLAAVPLPLQLQARGPCSGNRRHRNTCRYCNRLCEG